MTSADDLRARVNAHPLWYHTIELSPGVVTPGWFDLRPVVERMPWPDVTGKRCLDVGTYDGFLAFELERRGAGEVVATDIPAHDEWDWLPRERDEGTAALEATAGQKGRGFDIAAEALGSSVKRTFVNVYDLDPSDLGTFDVVVCGSLLLHLRDPFRALEAIRGVCRGEFLSAEEVDLARSVAPGARYPSLRLEGARGQWLVPNVRAHRYMLHVAGFDVLAPSIRYAVPHGPGHRSRHHGRRGLFRRSLMRMRFGSDGVPMAATRCTPAV